MCTLYNQNGGLPQIEHSLIYDSLLNIYFIISSPSAVSHEEVLLAFLVLCPWSIRDLYISQLFTSAGKLSKQVFDMISLFMREVRPLYKLLESL